MTEPWQCPACKTWIRGDVTEHRCPPQEGVGAEPIGPSPYSPTTFVWSPPPGWSVTTTNVPASTATTTITPTLTLVPKAA